MFSEHNDYVYREVLGMSDEGMDRLTAAGQIATEYDARVLRSDRALHFGRL